MKQEYAIETAAVSLLPPSAQAPELGLLDLLVMLGKRKRFLFSSLVVGATIAAIVAICLPNIYMATAVIVPPQQPQSTATALLGQLAPLAAMAGRDLGIKALSPGEQYIALLQSRTISDHLIDRFQLRTIYQDKTKTDARERLKGRTDFTTGKGALITITVEDRDPHRAAELAAAYIEELQKLDSRFAAGEAGERRAFLENRLSAERAALAQAEEQFGKNQSDTGLVHIDAQAQATIAAIAQLSAQIAAGEVGIQQLRLGATPDNPFVVQAETELDGLRAQLRKLEVKSPRQTGDPIVPIASLPTAGMDYIRRLRDLKYHEFLFEMLSKQYEAASLDESKAAPGIQVVDVPVPPEKRHSPHRTLIVLAGLILSGVGAAVYIWLEQLMAAPQNGEKVQLFRAAWRSGAKA